MPATTMTQAEYVAECKRLFGTREAWTLCEQVYAEDAWYHEIMTPADAVAEMNYMWCRRKADRNV